MNRFDVEQKYNNAGCVNYKLRDACDLKNILCIDVKKIGNWNNLSNYYKELTVDFLINFLNGCGLETREEYAVEKAYVCQKQELLSEKDSDGCRTIVGSIFLDVTNSNDIQIESLRVPSDYNDLKDTLVWKAEKVNNETTFLRVDLTKDNSKEWFHVYRKHGEVNFY